MAGSPPKEFLSTIKTYTNCLGQGAFGIVLEAINQSNVPIAVKIIFPAGDDIQYREKLRRESTVTKYLQHENIVKLKNVEEKSLTSADIQKIFQDLPSIQSSSALKIAYMERANGNETIESICIHMELCGENLRSWLRQSHCPNELYVQILQTKIIQGMISGVKYLHDNHVIHRDLKPENIVFSREGYQLPIKIGDFGYSRVIHSEEIQTSPITRGVGTRSYMAPEVWSDKYDHKADLFSLGLMMWEVAQLLKANQIGEMFDMFVYDNEEYLVEDHAIMKGIKQIIIRLTKRRTQDRMQSIDEVLNYVSEWSGERFYPRSSDELKSHLTIAPTRSTIFLNDGIYEGPFIVEKNNLVITGIGKDAVLKCHSSTCLTVVGNGCIVSGFKMESQNCGLKLDGNKNFVEQIEFEGGDPCLNIYGDDNKLGNLKISNASCGIKVNGNNNNLDKIELDNVPVVGILISVSSKGNQIVQSTARNVKRGICINGANNSVINAQFVKEEGQVEYTAVELKSGSHHAIDSLTCSGYVQSSNDWGVIVNAEYCFIKDSTLVPVQVLGGNATLTNVDCGPVIKVEKSAKNVNISKCKGQFLDSELAMGISNCNFQNFSKSAINYKSCLGTGGFGIVFKANDSGGTSIAIKVLFPPPPPNEEMEIDEKSETENGTETDEITNQENATHRRQMGRECTIPLGLEHPNLVKVIDAEERPFNYSDIKNLIDSVLPQEEVVQRRRLRNKCLEAEDRGCQEIYLIRMELCGETLWKWLKMGHNVEHEKIQIMQCKITLDLLEGVKYLHERKLIHRDLKPKNIMFAKEGFTFPVKIGDFGLCRILHSEATQTAPITKRVGTRPYWAPEVRERQKYTHRADLFSLGLVVWEVMQFISQTTLEKWVDHWKPDLVKEHPLRGVKEMIDKLIKRVPEERPLNIDHLETYTIVWRAILEKKPIQ